MLDPPSRKLLEALAHPVRMEIYDTLQVAQRPLTEGEIRALTLGGRRGVRAHLRVLQRAGLAHTTDTVRWVPLSPPVVVPDLDDVADGDPDQALVVRMHSLWQDRRQARLREWNRVNTVPAWARWRRHVVALDYHLRLTPDELHELELRLMATVREFRAEVTAAGGEDRDAVWLTMYAAPLDALRRR